MGSPAGPGGGAAPSPQGGANAVHVPGPMGKKKIKRPAINPIPSQLRKPSPKP